MHITHINFAKGFRGGERQTQLLIEELALQNFKQKLLVRKNSELTTRCKDIKGLEIIEISKPYILNVKHIKKPTILHAHETKALQFAYMANKFLGTPYIATRRVDNPIKNNFFNKKLYQNAKAVVGLSKAIKTEILHLSKNINIDIIPSAFSDLTLNKQKYSDIHQCFENKFLIGHVGALVDIHKGQSLLIEAAKTLATQIPEMHFILLGRGEDEKRFKLQANNIHNITFEGFVDNVNDYIHCFDLFVFPSRNEGLGSILFDVMRLNIPIIASNVGGIPDIITNEKNGLLIPTNNSKAIVDAILKLYKDKNKRELLAKNAKKGIEKFSPLNMANSYINIYKKIWSNT